MLGLNPKYKIIAFVGASGSGKTSLINELLQRLQSRGHRMMSVTTRAPRDSDPEGEYRYVTGEEFQALKDAGAFAWTTDTLHGARYGTLKSSIEHALGLPELTIMHLEPGCMRALLECATPSKVARVFITVPEDQLRARLVRRDPDRPAQYYDERIATCRQWEQDAQKFQPSYLFVENRNGRFEDAFTTLIRQLQGPSVEEILALSTAPPMVQAV